MALTTNTAIYCANVTTGASVKASAVGRTADSGTVLAPC